MLVKNIKRISFLILLIAVIAGAMWSMTRMYQGMFGDNHYYQRTRAYSTQDGLINQKLVDTKKLQHLTTLTHGTRYTGNTSLDRVAKDYHYRIGQDDILNFIGNDAKLRLYTESKLMTKSMLKDAATFWNTLAGQQIVVVVNQAKQSDEVIHDGKTKKGSLGGQTYNRQGMVFYPQNWKSSGLSASEKANWREAVLIREVGHALGIPSLGGGKQGLNAWNAGKIGSEVMGYWSVGSAAPQANKEGITSTSMDAAALALAGLSWEKPQRLAKWIYARPNGYVNYHNGKITTTIH